MTRPERKKLWFVVRSLLIMDLNEELRKIQSKIVKHENGSVQIFHKGFEFSYMVTQSFGSSKLLAIGETYVGVPRIGPREVQFDILFEGKSVKDSVFTYFSGQIEKIMERISNE